MKWFTVEPVPTPMTPPSTYWSAASAACFFNASWSMTLTSVGLSQQPA